MDRRHPLARSWRGNTVSPGYADGTAMVYAGGVSLVTARYTIDARAVEPELRRLAEAVASARADLETLQRSVAGHLGQSEAAIFATHVAFLDDRSFRESIESRIRNERVNAEQAVEQATGAIVQALLALEDPYLRERSQDLRDVGRRIVGHLAPSSGHDLSRLPPDAVLVAHELLPSQTASLDRRHVRAIVTEEGSKTSHASILAKALGIPAVTGVPSICAEVVSGARLLVDGNLGLVHMDPSAETLASFEQDREAHVRTLARADDDTATGCVTLDGRRIELHANLGRAGEAADVRGQGLAGVGLFRTEVLFLDDDVTPSLERQRDVYEQVARELRGLPLVIRTLDLGGDKRAVFLRLPEEHNPNIGLRGLRFALRESSMLRTQLAAILDVAQSHPVSVLFPMVVAGGDLASAIGVLHDVARERGSIRLPPIGAMIETPSSIFALPEILQLIDFISIGTNDLTQFMLAADRDAADLIDDFSILQPALLRALDMIVETATAAQVPVTVCGEAAGDPEIAPLLVGLGIRRLSMSPLRAGPVDRVLRRSRLDALEHLAQRALECATPEAVHMCIAASLRTESAEAVPL